MENFSLNGKSILITGGTGSFGRKFTEMILQQWPSIKRLVIFSRDEQKQYQMALDYPHAKFPMMRFFIGDVRDIDRLRTALQGIDYVIHAAALKHVHIAEYNPMECVKTNVLGAENLIQACIEANIKKVVALSTDKACAPINLYGATKLASDKLFIAGNNIKGNREITFSVVRYGNVMGSNGSVIPFFLSKRKEGKLPITHPGMTRFNIALEEGVRMVFYALEKAWGGEIFVPKIPSFKVTDLAEAIAPGCPTEIIGIRPGEKIHEEMITSSDAFSTYDLGKYFSILPQAPIWELAHYLQQFKATLVPDGFHYSSGTNKEWLSVEQLRTLIKKYVDPHFSENLIS
jgi:UDP-N-acetylglucosamine 4,6-dehydratase